MHTPTHSYGSRVQRHYRLNVKQTAISGVYYMACCTFLMNMCVQVVPLPPRPVPVRGCVHIDVAYRCRYRYRYR